MTKIMNKPYLINSIGLVIRWFDMGHVNKGSCYNGLGLNGFSLVYLHSGFLQIDAKCVRILFLGSNWISIESGPVNRSEWVMICLDINELG